MMVEMRLGTFTNFIIEEALTASVEPITPPKRKPNANENPGNTILATHATAAAVIKTTIKARLEIMRRHFHISFSDSEKTSAYRRGGKKMISTKSGFSVMVGTLGIKLIANPPNTKRIGYATLSRFANIISSIIATIRSNK